MILSLRQYSMLMLRRKTIPGYIGNFKKYAGLWDVPVQGKDAHHKWGLCYSECYGVPYSLSSQFSSGQKKEIEKAMKEIELATCIR